MLRLPRLTTAVLAIGASLLVLGPALAAPPSPSFGPAIDAYPQYDGESSCDPNDKPGVVDFRAMVMNAYPGTGSGGGIARPCTGGISEHEEGRAWDWVLDARDPADHAAADDLFAWLTATDEHGNANARLRRLGIMYMIWDRQVFKTYQADRGWQPYSGSSPHTDHVHFSFSRAGAAQQTTWWTARTGPGTTAPQPAPAPAPPPPADLQTVLAAGGASRSVEVHALTRSSGFSRFGTQSGTAFGVVDPAQWRFLVGARDDLVGIRLAGGASGRVEVHVASAASGYRSFTRHTATPLGAVDPAQWQPSLGPSGDLSLVRTTGGASGAVEVHVLSAAGGYSAWSSHAATAIAAPSGAQAWRFLVGDGGDLVGVLHRGGASRKTEVHVLSAASGYRSFVSHAAAPVGETDPARWEASVGHYDGDADLDLWLVALNGTASKRTEVHVLGGAGGFSSFAGHHATALNEITRPSWSATTG